MKCEVSNTVVIETDEYVFTKKNGTWYNRNSVSETKFDSIVSHPGVLHLLDIIAEKCSK